MKRILFILTACGALGFVGTVSAQGLGAGAGSNGRPNSEQAQQRVQAQLQQRVQAQVEVQAQARAQAQAQQAAGRVQQRLESQAQNRAAQAEAQAYRAVDAAQQRTAGAGGARAEAGAQGDVRFGAGPAQAEGRANVQADAHADAAETGGIFGRFNPFKAPARPATKPASSMPAAGTDDPTTASEDQDAEVIAKMRGRGLAVAQFTDARGQARAELARTMQLRAEAISALRDRALESGDVQALEKADRLEAALNRALEARRRGQTDAEAEAVVEANLPVPPAATNVDGTSVEAGVAGAATTESNVAP